MNAPILAQKLFGLGLGLGSGPISNLVLGSSVASLITAAVQIADSSCGAHTGDLSCGSAAGATQERAPVVRVHAPGLAKTNALLQVTAALTPRDVLERFHLTLASAHAVPRAQLLADEFARAAALSDSAPAALDTTAPSAIAAAAITALTPPSASECAAPVALSAPSRPLPDIAENETLGEPPAAPEVDSNPSGGAPPSSPVEQFFLYEVGGTICILILFPSYHLYASYGYIFFYTDIGVQ